MNVSGILVVTSVERLDETATALSALPGVEVHHTDPAGGRLVITQEASSVHEEMDGLKRIKALPHIVLAEMVHHHFEDSKEMLDPIAETEVPAQLKES